MIIEKKHWATLALITVVGGWLRFNGLGNAPLWVDECIFYDLIRRGGTQEFVPVWIATILGLHSEFWLRSMSALAGTLTIVAIYPFKGDRSAGIYPSIVVAVMPLFVFWSRLARPYAVAGLFMVLGWRYWQFYILAVVTTPISLIGVRITDKKWGRLIGFAVLAIFMYVIRPDSDKFFSLSSLWTAFTTSRWMYLPALAALLYGTEYLLPWLRHRYSQKKRTSFL
jgi:uncharacterized membrane protein